MSWSVLYIQENIPTTATRYPDCNTFVSYNEYSKERPLRWKLTWPFCLTQIPQTIIVIAVNFEQDKGTIEPRRNWYETQPRHVSRNCYSSISGDMIYQGTQQFLFCCLILCALSILSYASSTNPTCKWRCCSSILIAWPSIDIDTILEPTLRHAQSTNDDPGNKASGVSMEVETRHDHHCFACRMETWGRNHQTHATSKVRLPLPTIQYTLPGAV